MGRVVIGLDPHKRSNTVAVLDDDERELAAGRFANDRDGYRALRAFAREWPQRLWAVEGSGGAGKHIAQRLVADAETVVDVAAKQAARVRVYSTGNGRKNDATDARSIAVVALRTPDLSVVAVDDVGVALRLLSGRRGELVAAHVDRVPAAPGVGRADPQRRAAGLVGHESQGIARHRAFQRRRGQDPPSASPRISSPTSSPWTSGSKTSRRAMMAAAQITHPGPGRSYYLRKTADGKSKLEAMRYLKRRLSDVIYRRLVHDAQRAAKAGPGGHTGTTVQSSGRLNPDSRLFGKATHRTRPKAYAPTRKSGVLTQRGANITRWTCRTAS